MKNKPQHLRGYGYWDRIRDKAAELGTDGCTCGTAAFRDCCLEHDVHWRTGQTINEIPITEWQSNTRLRSCIQSRSRFGWYSPTAWWRYAVVTLVSTKRQLMTWWKSLAKWAAEQAVQWGAKKATDKLKKK